MELNAARDKLLNGRHRDHGHPWSARQREFGRERRLSSWKRLFSAAERRARGEARRRRRNDIAGRETGLSRRPMGAPLTASRLQKSWRP
jgi:hypothetical protein